MWFDSWFDIVRLLLVGTAAYVSLVLVLRISGKRTLATLNAFDLVVTVALGSTLATILLSSDVAWSEGVVALGLLVALQVVVAWSSARLPRGRSIVNARPALLVQDGTVRSDELRRQRMTERELRQAVRSSGVGSLAEVAAVVLESNGQFSVIRSSALGDGSALQDVPDWLSPRAS